MNLVSKRDHREEDLPAWSESSRSRPPHAAGEHQRWIDLAVAVMVFLYDLMYLTGMVVVGEFSTPVFLVALALSAGESTFYVLRHRSVPVMFIGVVALACVEVVLGVGLSPAPMLVLGLMLYAVGTRFGWRVVVPAVAVASLWVGAASVPVVQNGWARVGAIGMLMLAYVVAALVGVLTRGRRARFEALREHAGELARERDTRAVIAAAEERARIAREIHDIVSHSLGTMVVMADGAVQTVDADPQQASVAMVRVRDTGREAMTQMRRMLDVLRNDDPAMRSPQPGLAQLDRLVEETRSTGLRVDLAMTGVPITLRAGADLAGYRIVQEALTNARRHGGRLLSLITVTVTYAQGAVHLRVVDDGREPATAGTKGSGSGHGLVGMRERVSAYGGSLQTGLRPGGGFEVQATLPTGGQP